MDFSGISDLTGQPVVLSMLVALLVLVATLAVLLYRMSRSRNELAAQLDQARSESAQTRAGAMELEHQAALEHQRLEQMQDALDQQTRQSNSKAEEAEHWRQKATGLDNRVAALESENNIRSRRVEQLEQELRHLQSRNDDISRELNEARVSLREQEVTLEEERRATREKLELLERNRDALKQEFENLANKIFEQKSERFSQQSRTSLDTLLTPFRDQLQDFRKRVEDVYTSETRDRQALRSEIKSLQELNRQITEEASNLTRALKGDKKVQGNWGELILEQVLERSGLRKGVEYDTQGSYRDDDNQLMRPDVIVHLPDKRTLVVDSKVSLQAYQQWATEDDESVRADLLKQHVDAVRNHIKSLSEKDYSQLHGLHSPDFVLMFMPIEPAFVAAFQQDENLFAEAFERKIIVVTPSTLLATLRTVENIWRYERQSRNAQRIAERAGAIYDKLRVFVEAMEKMGTQLQTVHGTYDNAMNTLTHGRGNLISQASRFVELGVRVKKEMPRTVMEKAEVDSAEDDPEEPGIGYQQEDDGQE